MTTNSIINIAAYKFITLTDLPTLRENFLTECEQLAIKGTILLSAEGINLILAGEADAIEKFIETLRADARFADMDFKKSTSAKRPFRRLKVRLKEEIITLRQNDIDPEKLTGAHISAQELKTWLDEGREFNLLDTRNDYEVEMGTFEKAVTLPIKFFTEFPDAVEAAALPKDKPIVMFCTGGVRCEKASAVMLKQGYQAVHQLDGGILKYFEECGGEHYQGNCFVFDERTAITPEFAETGMAQCPRCKNFVSPQEQRHPQYNAWHSCQFCQANSVGRFTEASTQVDASKPT